MTESHREEESTIKPASHFSGAVWHAPWPIYYLLMSVCFLYTFYVDFSLQIPYGVSSEPQSMFFFILLYLLLLIHTLAPETLLTRDDLKKMRIMKKIFPIILLVQASGPVLIFVFSMQSESLMIMTCVILGFQMVFFKECLLVLCSDFINRVPLEAYLYSVSHIQQAEGASPRISVPGIGLIDTLLFSSLYSSVIFMGSFPTYMGNPSAVSLLQYIYVILTHQVLSLIFSSVYAISSIMMITSPTTSGTFKKHQLIFKKILQSLGVIVYMGFISFLLLLLGIPRVLSCYLILNRGAKMRLEQVFRKYFTTMYFYHIYGIKPILITSVLFGISPKKAVKKLIEITNNSEGSFIKRIRSGYSEKTTLPLSAMYSLVILTPICLTHFIASILFSEEGFLKMLPMILVSTFLAGGAAYLKAEAIHIIVLLSHHEKIFLVNNWGMGEEGPEPEIAR